MNVCEDTVRTRPRANLLHNGRIASIILFEMEKRESRERAHPSSTGQQQSWLVLQEFTTLFCLLKSFVKRVSLFLSLSLSLSLLSGNAEY